MLQPNYDDSAEPDTAKQGPDEPVTVRLFRPSPEALSLVIETGAEEVSFGPEHLDDGNFRAEDYFAGAWAGNWLAHANGFEIEDDGTVDPQSRKFHIPFSFWSSSEAEDRRMQHIAVIGIETSPGDMPQSRTARYRGSGRLEAWPTDEPYSRARMQFNIDEVRLTADFGDGTVSGVLDEWELRVGGGPRSPIDTSYDLLPAAIDGNGFSASLAPSADCSGMCPAMPASRVAGGFYGPYAAEVGGTLETGEFSHDGRTWIGLGVIYTNED